MNEYDAIADLYELEIGEHTDDLPFLLELARHTGGPVLDAGCGSGRVTAALAGAGYECTGIDSSAAMLALAHRRIAALRGARVLQADLRCFRLNLVFRLIAVAHGTFGHLTSREAQEHALAAFRQHLAPGGVLVLVLQNPYDWALDQSLDELVAGWEKPGPGPGEVTRQTYATHTDRAAQLRHVRLWYDTTGPDGVLRRRGAAFSLRWTYQPELELLLERNGFAPKHWYGSYDLEPYDERSPLLIAVASPAQ